MIPDYLDPESPRRTFASILFEYVIGGFPEPGDILRFEDVAALFSAEKVSAEVATVLRAWAKYCGSHCLYTPRRREIASTTSSAREPVGLPPLGTGIHRDESTCGQQLCVRRSSGQEFHHGKSALPGGVWTRQLDDPGAKGVKLLAIRQQRGEGYR